MNTPPRSLMPEPGSFRDPSGHVYRAETAVYRTIQPVYSRHWEAARASGFLDKAQGLGLLHAFAESEPLPGSWKTLQSPLLPFISYPYEWCFSQLKDAARHTLEIMRLALDHGLILKDASAYNVQFKGSAPVFIDHLSFEIWQKNLPWVAYLQFCRHFLAPLALMARRSPECGLMLAHWIDGLPLELTAMLLPFSTRLSPFLYIHIHAHARLQKKYQDARQHARRVKELRVSEKTVPRLVASLAACIDGLRLPAQKTVWGEYYEDTNYSEAAHSCKAEFTRAAAGECPGNFAVDLGANTGLFSRILAERFRSVVAADMDHLAVEKMYLQLRKEGNNTILPLALNLSNPTPPLGWAGGERRGFMERCAADMICALALIHHLTLGAGIPLDRVAEFFASLLKPGGVLLLEFVPLEDSQVRRMLAARDTVFTEYSLEECLKVFGRGFALERQSPLPDSARTLLLLRKKTCNPH